MTKKRNLITQSNLITNFLYKKQYFWHQPLVYSYHSNYIYCHDFGFCYTDTDALCEGGVWVRDAFSFRRALGEED